MGPESDNTGCGTLISGYDNTPFRENSSGYPRKRDGASPFYGRITNIVLYLRDEVTIHSTKKTQ
jgi:hypothetical protein